MREECNMSHYPRKEYTNAILRLARQGMQHTKPNRIETKNFKKGEKAVKQKSGLRWWTSRRLQGRSSTVFAITHLLALGSNFLVPEAMSLAINITDLA